ncbi:MAG: M50 family metallopeptidase, partial [Melioribacteraceae bacterium]|nr:M50 family metallopeptidase [Melioribacteraceae bacterium]
MKKKKSNLWIELVVLLLGTLILLFAWNSIFSYPIKIFIVLVHEISHALIGIISGSTIHSIEIFENLGGRCSLTGGNEFLIAFAGYFGSVILGVILFMSSFDKQKSKVAAIILTVILLLTVVNLVNDYRAIIFSFIILILMN